MDRATAQSRTRDKINLVTGGQGLTFNKFDRYTSRVYLTELSELPDRVRQYPLACQRDYLVTYNNNLRRYGSLPYAMKAAWRALEHRKEKLEHDRRAAAGKINPEDIARQIIDKATPLRPQIVVA
ncbi:MAG: hypothetical protein AB1752_11625 [Candidatus Zixiibacteriota bacterium]